ncbi:MAG TPA: N-methyl-L-tryptophan oxidase [Drouetiella sp.]
MEFETIVVGGGAAGCSAAYHLARDGCSVLLLEQFDLGHNRGSSHGESRIIRLSYANPGYIKLARAAFQHWSEIESDAEEKLVFMTGGLDLAGRDHKSLNNRIASLQKERIKHEVIDAGEIRLRYPQFRITNDTIGLVQADAGIVRADRAVQVMARLVRKHGGEVFDKTAVTSIDITDSGARVLTDNGQYSCSKLIIAAGSWTAPVLARLGLTLPLTVTHEQYAFFKPSRKEPFEIGSFPVFIHFNSDPPFEVTCRYGFPIFGQDGVKVADEQTPGIATTTETRTFEIDETRIQRLSDYVQTALPEAHGEIMHATTCLYTRTPDEDFIIDKLPGYPHVVIASVCSGHGFKFASVAGRILADLSERGTTKHGIDQFAISRF